MTFQLNISVGKLILKLEPIYRYERSSKEMFQTQTNNVNRYKLLWKKTKQFFILRLLYACNSPGKNTGVGGHSLLQANFLAQGSNPGPLMQANFLPSEPPGKPKLKRKKKDFHKKKKMTEFKKVTNI